MKKLKLFIILGVEFAALAFMLILIFMAGKKQYTVTFDLNGGTLLGGNLEQSVTQGSDASPPSAYKAGHYLRGWSGSYKKVTGDVTVKAIWEYETTPGIEYATKQTYAEITGSFSALEGEIYIGAYYGDYRVLGIRDSAFENRDRIEKIHLLSGIIKIGNATFRDCDSLESIELPSSTTSIGEEAFANCKSLKKISLPASLRELGKRAFADCKSLETVYISSAIEHIDASAFEGCTSLKKVVFKSPSSNKDKEIEIKPTLIIDNSAFKNCVKLESIELPSHTLAIADEAFYGCSSLTEIVIPEKVAIIGAGAFNTDGLKIKLDHNDPSTIPFGWVSSWNIGGTVIYGYDKDAEE